MTQLSSEKPEFFKGRHFNHLLIIQAVRWYVTYKLSYRDMCDLMSERDISNAPTQVFRSATETQNDNGLNVSAFVFPHFSVQTNRR